MAARLRSWLWQHSLPLRRPARRLRRRLAVLAYRWRAARGSGEPPRVLTDPATAAAPPIEDPAIVVHPAEGASATAVRRFLDRQTEDSVRLSGGGGEPTPYGLVLPGALEEAPATLLESLLLAAAAEDLAWATGGWSAPAPGRHGPQGDLVPFAPGAAPALLRLRRPCNGPATVLGRAVPHITEPGAPPDAAQPSPLVASGPHTLPPDARSGQVVHLGVHDLHRRLRRLPEIPGPRGALFLLPYLAVGGAERLLFDLLAGLSERYRLLVVTLDPHRAGLGQSVDACRRLTPHVYTLGDWLPREAHLGALRHLLRRYRVEALVSWNGTVDFYDRAAELKAAHPELRILHQLYNHEGGWIERLSPAFLGCVDTHLAVNRRIAAALERRRIPAPRIAVVHHGVAVPAAAGDAERRQRRSRSREELGLPADAVVVGSFLRLHPQKRPLDILRLARRFAGRRRGEHRQGAQRGPDVCFLLAGGGPLDADVDRELAARPLPNLIRLPFRHDLERLYDAIDLCLMTSSYEGLPVFLLDGLARGLPCVTTAVGDVPLLLAGGGGMLVERPGDLDALEAAVSSLLDPERRRAEGERGRRTVAERFGLATYRERYETLIFPPPPRAADA